jgi:hypothetical protein
MEELRWRVIMRKRYRIVPWSVVYVFLEREIDTAVSVVDNGGHTGREGEEAIVHVTCPPDTTAGFLFIVRQAQVLAALVEIKKLSHTNSHTVVGVALG